MQGDHAEQPPEGPSHSPTMSLSSMVVRGSTHLQEEVFNAIFHQIATIPPKKTQHPQSGRHCHRLILFLVGTVGRAGLVTATAVLYVGPSISALSHLHKAWLSLPKTNGSSSPPCQLCFAPSTIYTHIPQVPPILGRFALFLCFLATYTATAAMIKSSPGISTMPSLPTKGSNEGFALPSCPEVTQVPLFAPTPSASLLDPS